MVDAGRDGCGAIEAPSAEDSLCAGRYCCVFPDADSAMAFVALLVAACLLMVT